jgi:hypothetical protein
VFVDKGKIGPIRVAWVLDVVVAVGAVVGILHDLKRLARRIACERVCVYVCEGVI